LATRQDEYGFLRVIWQAHSGREPVLQVARHHRNAKTRVSSAPPDTVFAPGRNKLRMAQMGHDPDPEAGLNRRAYPP
jgi:hypothetical protein